MQSLRATFAVTPTAGALPQAAGKRQLRMLPSGMVTETGSNLPSLQGTSQKRKSVNATANCAMVPASVELEVSFIWPLVPLKSRCIPSAFFSSRHATW